MADPSYTGRCLCGALRCRVAGAAGHLCFCHCRSCRRASGAPFVAWGTFARERFTLNRGELAEYRSSRHVVRGFCPACGGALTYRHAKRPAEIDVTLATLDEPAVLAPGYHIWVREKLPWLRIEDGLPQCQQCQRFRTNDD